MPSNITRIPAPRVPLLDLRTGLVSREWFRFFNNLFVITGNGTSEFNIDDFNLEPDPIAGTADELAVAESDIQGLSLQSGSDGEVNSQLAVLQSEIDALKIEPPPDQQVFADYAMVYDTTTHTPAAINTAYAVTFNTTAFARGIRIGSPTSRILCNRPGIYNFISSAQIDKTSGGTGNIWFWGRKNGTNIADSASRVQIQGNNAELVTTVNFYVEMSNGDYFELMYAVDSTSVIILTEAATAFAPAVPSVILTVNQVNL